MTRSGINPLAAEGVRVVDLMCDERFYEPSIYSADGFHPNDQGYALFSEHVVRAATAASYPVPQADCPPMAFVS